MGIFIFALCLIGGCGVWSCLQCDYLLGVACGGFVCVRLGCLWYSVVGVFLVGVFEPHCLYVFVGLGFGYFVNFAIVY